MIEDFHFLRPWWLLGLIALAWLVLQLRRRGLDSGDWRAVIDPRLLPHVLSRDTDSRRNRQSWLLALAAMLAIIALAGPTWEKRPQSVYQQPSSLVLALDLSRSMNAADIKPSRLVRARHKITDILNARKEGQSALIVYAADAFAVTPLTSDVDTILALLPDLETGLMPAQGTRADRAFERALELFDNSGVARGDLLLVSDGFSEPEIAGLEKLLKQHPGHRISVLAIGTPGGGPIPLSNGGFLKDRAGNIVIAAMDSAGMRGIAEHSGGAFVTLSAADDDVDRLMRQFETAGHEQEARISARSADLWRELGPTLILLALPLVALAFRRGLIWSLPLLLLLPPPDAQALDWQELWRNDDQRALQLFEQGEHEAAAEMFDDESWRASASYRAGDYAAAAEEWQDIDSEDARYNHANALARQGAYQQALAAYDSLLQQNPEHEDALYNRQAIQDWLDQQQQQSGPQQQAGEQSRQADGDQQQQQPSGQGMQPQDGQDQAGAGSAQDQGSRQERQDQQARAQSQQQDSAGGEEPPPAQSASAQRDRQKQDEAAEQGDADATLADLDQQMSEQAAQQWLRKIPDDPGGLLRRKFLYQYRRRGGVDLETQTW